MKTIGFLVNPIAGMGGKTALKGTDGEAVLALAKERGAVPEAGGKAERALLGLLPMKYDLHILCGAGEMGEEICRRLGFSFKAVGEQSACTTAEDTVRAAALMADAGVSLLLFAGGDGTARDVFRGVQGKVPVLGIPAGVKIQSAVFALDPETAGRTAAAVLSAPSFDTEEREVADLDEDAYRTGHVSARLYGVMKTPRLPAALQSMKQSGFITEEAAVSGIGAYLSERMKPNHVYAVGAGTTAKCLMRELGLPYELLGVDLIKNGQLLASDVTEEEIWETARKEPMSILVSPIGGQGFLFGRGNHQFSPRILRAVGREGITVVSTVEKLLSLKGQPFHVDCADPETEKMLRGFYQVLCGYGYFVSYLCK